MVFFEFLLVILNAKESASFTVIKGISFNKVCKVENLKIFKHKLQQKSHRNL